MTRNNLSSSNTLCAQLKKHEQTIETLLKITKHFIHGIDLTNHRSMHHLISCFVEFDLDEKTIICVC
jgi:hypothetical protein